MGVSAIGPIAVIFRLCPSAALFSGNCRDGYDFCGGDRPYSLFHFSRTSNFGLAANMISIPLMGFWVMPAAIAAIIFIPLDADGAFWRLAASGVGIMLAMAQWTANLPGAVTVFPHWPSSALGVLTIGGLWLCLMSAPWRLCGIAALPVSIALIAAQPHPRIYVSEEGDNVGVLFDAPGERVFAVFDARKGRFDTEVWMEQAGIDTVRVKASRLDEFANCDIHGCVTSFDGRMIAISNRQSGLKDDCGRADLVIALYPVANWDRQGCKAALIDRRDAWNSGAHAVYISNAGIRAVSSAAIRGARPWTFAEASDAR
jgi:competence protein ComEC